MGTKANENVVKRFIDLVWRHGKTDQLDELLAANCTFHDLADHEQNQTGASVLKRNVPEYRKMFASVAIEIEDLIAAGRAVVVRAQMRARHVAGRIRGIEACGQRVSYQSITIYWLEDGRITDIWTCEDAVTMLRQLGMAIPRFAA